MDTTSLSTRRLRHLRIGERALRLLEEERLATARMPRSGYELYSDDSGRFWFRIKATNGETILLSEPFDNRSAALQALDFSAKIIVYRDTSDEYRFRVTAKNGQTLAVSERFATRAGVHHAIDRVRLYLPAVTSVEDPV